MIIENSAYFRKGKVGDWQNHMSEEMGRKLDCIVKVKLEGSGLIIL
jgi:estrone sulfotransferase